MLFFLLLVSGIFKFLNPLNEICLSEAFLADWAHFAAKLFGAFFFLRRGPVDG